MESSWQQDQFVEQFIRSQGRVYAYIVTLLPNRDDTEEVFQQTSLALWKKWQEFDPTRDFVRWASSFLPGNHQAMAVNTSDMSIDKLVPNLSTAGYARNEQR